MHQPGSRHNRQQPCEHHRDQEQRLQHGSPVRRRQGGVLGLPLNRRGGNHGAGDHPEQQREPGTRRHVSQRGKVQAGQFQQGDKGGSGAQHQPGITPHIGAAVHLHRYEREQAHGNQPGQGLAERVGGPVPGGIGSAETGHRYQQTDNLHKNSEDRNAHQRNQHNRPTAVARVFPRPPAELGTPRLGRQDGTGKPVGHGVVQIPEPGAKGVAGHHAQQQIHQCHQDVGQVRQYTDVLDPAVAHPGSEDTGTPQVADPHGQDADQGYEQDVHAVCRYVAGGTVGAQIHQPGYKQRNQQQQDGSAVAHVVTDRHTAERGRTPDRVRRRPGSGLGLQVGLRLRVRLRFRDRRRRRGPSRLRGGTHAGKGRGGFRQRPRGSFHGRFRGSFRPR